MSERTILRLHAHQALEAKCISRGSRFRTVVAVGGVGSGKTLTLARWMIDRGKWDTRQYHALFATTGPQLHGAILDEVLPWLELAGIDSVWNKRPPAEWVERWRIAGIKTPPRRKKYTNILILSSGMHIYCGSTSNKSYRQVKGMKFGSVVIEEVTAGPTEEAVRYLRERLRCGIGRDRCAQEHHHVLILHGNPPDEDGHWIYAWLANQEKQAARKAGVELGDDNDSYPNLLRGVGDVIFIPSNTHINEAHLPADYIGDIETSVDEETAKRVLRGNMARKKTGRAYNGFEKANEFPVEYDIDRTLYVFFDYNTNPAVAGFAHPLRPGCGEYPSEYERPGLTHIGVFGEYFHVGGTDAHQMSLAIARGDCGSNGSMPRNWRGIKEHRGPVVAFGDATAGAKRSMTGTTPWQIVNEVFREACRDPETKTTRYSVNVGTENPLQQIRLRSVNAKFVSAAGVRSLWISPRCHELITDLNTVVTKPDGTILKPGGPRPGSKFWLRTHISDGLGYLIHTLFPMGREMSTSPSNSLPKFGGSPNKPPRMTI